MINIIHRVCALTSGKLNGLSARSAGGYAVAGYTMRQIGRNDSILWTFRIFRGFPFSLWERETASSALFPSCLERSRPGKSEGPIVLTLRDFGLMLARGLATGSGAGFSAYRHCVRSVTKQLLTN